jgi:hypothetical protein
MGARGNAKKRFISTHMAVNEADLFRAPVLAEAAKTRLRDELSVHAAKSGRVVTEVVFQHNRMLTRDAILFFALARTAARPGWRRPRKERS